MIYELLFFFNIFFKLIIKILKIKFNNYLFMMGIGDWGLGPIPNPQSPIPNPQSPIPNPQKLKYK